MEALARQQLRHLLHIATTGGHNVITFGRGGGGYPDLPRFGLVRFEPGSDRRVRDTLITFDTAAAADLFAIEQRWTDDYQVSPLRFFVPDELRPPVGARLPFDNRATRLLGHRRWA